MTSLNGSFQGLIPKEPKILARPEGSGKSHRVNDPSAGIGKPDPYNVCKLKTHPPIVLSRLGPAG